MSVGPASPEPPVWERRSVEAGGWRITALSDGFFRLDGGSMWGVVPANLWRSMTPPAEDNTILLALRPFLAERGDEKVVIEVGIGDRWEPKWRDIYHILPTATLADTLRKCGVDPEEVTRVVASHCHWDHIGAQLVEREGALVPRFPNAVHHAPLAEVEMARRPDHARKGSYRSEDVTVIEEHGLLQPFEGSAELLAGLRVHVLGGHSDGVSLITFGEEEDGETAVFWADVVPTTHHAQPPYIMAYDIDVVRSFEVRSRWLERAAEEGWIGLFYHDVDHAFARIHRDGRRYEVDAIPGEPGAAAD
ncbi:MAG: MBL fold metallo-hydrolase [Planctomycetota bacterium]|jgi:glyoxylase-like metal-dependent hydrolase (beta-lactamase superfamily II)|nr:MBL fold metallo-hydrolase [Planctomycetota bacterium]MDP6763162.1 MBL fold metallo-hydrolase [Planctomycetota bacterium]MDP6989854.1 MBL fold metallo-hydrolase [Planctomycetota bacterium]